MRVVFLASGTFAEPTLRWLGKSDHEIPLVITQPARGRGRGRKITETSIRSVARELGIEVLAPENVNTPEVVERVRDLDADIGVVVAFGQKLGQDFLSAIPGGCINLHASLLPKYRGAAPINWALVHGEKTTGCTVFRIVERMDAGPVLSSHATEIVPGETAGDLHDRLAVLGVDTVSEALGLFDAHRLPDGTPQDDASASLAPKLTKAQGIIDFDRPTRQVFNHILGMTPWPGATTRFHATDGRWENVTITSVREAAGGEPSGIAPGTINTGRNIATADGALEILTLKPSSGREMTWAEYINGRHVIEGERFLPPT